MNTDHYWQKSYPERLQNYSLNCDELPSATDSIAAEAARHYDARAALTLVLPAGVHVSLSFAEVDSLSDAFAAFLVHRLGAVQGDVVAIQLPNSIHYPIAVFGAWKAGLVVTNVNPLYTERELDAQLADCGAKLLIASDLFVQRAERVVTARGVKLVVASLWDFFSDAAATLIKLSMQAESTGGLTSTVEYVRFSDAIAVGKTLGNSAFPRHPVALYQYTGGTTGRSKGAVLTHKNLLAVLQMTDDFLHAYDARFTSADTILTVLPMYHIFAFVINFLSFFRAGARNVLVPNPRPLTNLRPAFEQFAVTWMTGVDTLYAGLLSEPWFRSNPPKLKYAISGGTALRPTTGQQWRELVCPMLEGYGLTESSCIVAFNPPGASYRPGSVGLPMPGSEVRVIDGNGRLLGPGGRGELLVRGPHMLAAYLNRPDETATAVVDGWFYTGDIVVMEPDGYITIVDRKKDMVLVSGFNVYPNEVEAVITEHPDVVEAAVIGVPDEGTGEAVQAIVVARRADLTAEEIIRHCRARLTGYKVPKQVLFRDQLPKSPVGKILRAALR
ncbi:AMP-binding protein [Noviherbaspirillum saxi]|uniref:Long-chain-fatty-acid--CoA ligase n=1 Tax=Noviherbaspirillum saxi TaxID=2320863 RepID=A0A3A3FNE1_9BURK|nr:AMP-binding protein [Noviherbaspirillum saxi]RJF95985.1 long-chain fatty acid--CoA ligase [Noviherbaspirillum saxi]